MERIHQLLEKLQQNDRSQVQAEQLLGLAKERESLKDRPTYRDFLAKLSKYRQNFSKSADAQSLSDGAVTLGQREQLSEQEFNTMTEMAQALIPWKKGPFNLFGQKIDGEWRSDLKWERVSSHISDLEGKSVLDIGCNNGYFMFRLLEKKPQLVLGIDPVVPNWAQFHFLHHTFPDPRLFFQLWGVEHLKYFNQTFDLILSMGIVYHHRNPIEQLIETKKALTPGGELILETIGIPGEQSHALFPSNRYAKMKNVWFVPTVNCFLNWVKRARFCDVELISVSEMTSDEQRLTDWCPPPRQSLDDFLDPNDRTKTIEGHPAPIRMALKARRHPDDRQ